MDYITFKLILFIFTIINICLISFTKSTFNDEIEVFLNEKHDDWWIVDQERDKTRQVYIRFVDLDEGKIHSCYQYKVILLC